MNKKSQGSKASQKSRDKSVPLIPPQNRDSCVSGALTKDFSNAQPALNEDFDQLEKQNYKIFKTAKLGNPKRNQNQLIPAEENHEEVDSDVISIIEEANQLKGQLLDLENDESAKDEIKTEGLEQSSFEESIQDFTQDGFIKATTNYKKTVYYVPQA